jgi:glycosyltransferase involved in cell wall biosynthesis
MNQVSISIIIPTFNGAKRIGNCLEALLKQTAGRNAEILVVNDGATDNTTQVVQRFSGVRLLTQTNAGPAAARNHGAHEAAGKIILFTDDDCEPAPGWLDAMLKPFADPEVVGVKGAYRTRQKPLIARFVQAEYEDRYRFMARMPEIDFIDTYSAAFRRDKFLEMRGYDTEFPVACAEDIELSYRMSAKGWKMKFIPEAVVFHQHPDSLVRYLKKKFKFAFWRVLAVRKNPQKAVKDSHTPQLMKLQLFFGPAVLLGLAIDLLLRPPFSLVAIVVVGFLMTTIPFALRSAVKDPAVGAISPIILAARSCSQLLGIVSGIFGARQIRA